MDPLLLNLMDSPDPAREAPWRRAAATLDLHACPACGGRHVHPVEWAFIEEDRWDLTLTCHNCFWAGGGVYGAEVLELLEADLDHDIDSIVADLRQLEAWNMEEYAEAFAAALAAGALLPEDF